MQRVPQNNTISLKRLQPAPRWISTAPGRSPPPPPPRPGAPVAPPPLFWPAPAPVHTMVAVKRTRIRLGGCMPIDRASQPVGTFRLDLTGPQHKCGWNFAGLPRRLCANRHLRAPTRLRAEPGLLGHELLERRAVRRLVAELRTRSGHAGDSGTHLFVVPPALLRQTSPLRRAERAHQLLRRAEC